jgi:cytochrome c oxidase subunit 4
VSGHDDISHPSLGAHVLTLAGLLALTAATVAIARVPLGPWNAPVALAIATAKASLVLLVFMHLRRGPRSASLAVGAGVLWLLLLLGLTLVDYVTRGPA